MPGFGPRMTARDPRLEADHGRWDVVEITGELHRVERPRAGGVVSEAIAFAISLAKSSPRRIAREVAR